MVHVHLDNRIWENGRQPWMCRRLSKHLTERHGTRNRNEYGTEYKDLDVLTLIMTKVFDLHLAVPKVNSTSYLRN